MVRKTQQLLDIGLQGIPKGDVVVLGNEYIVPRGCQEVAAFKIDCHMIKIPSYIRIQSHINAVLAPLSPAPIFVKQPNCRANQALETHTMGTMRHIMRPVTNKSRAMRFA